MPSFFPSSVPPRPVGIRTLLAELRAGTIRPDAVAAAFRRRHAGRTLLGRLAINAGMLTTKQVFETVARQEELQQPFGQVAISLGFLTQVDVECLLALQLAEVHGTPLQSDELEEFVVQVARDASRIAQ